MKWFGQSWRMRWFGQSWGAPICEAVGHEETPIGTPCAYCDKSIAEGDQGLILYLYGNPGDPPTIPYHYQCMMESFGL